MCPRQPLFLYSSHAYDEVLCFIAKMMRSVSREGDLCCRSGGEEFYHHFL
ncbi:diguanylate cyclase domain-containing protein [Paenibacillus sedimenti]